MSAAAVSSTTGYINYVYNVEAKGVAQFSSQILGASSAINNMLGQLAFQTSAYLSRVESATMSMGIVASAGLYKATQQAIQFDYAMQSVQAIAGKSNIGDLGDQAMQMSNKFGVAVDKMVKGLESLARAGVSPQNMSGILEQAMGLSKLEDLDLDTAINELLSTTNLLDTKNLDLESPEYVEALKYQNQKITATSEAAPINAQDIIHTLQHVGGYASSTNIDQDDLYAVIAQLGAKGTKSEIAGTSLRAFLAAGQKDTAQRALKRLGLSVNDLWKNDDTIMSISDMKDVLDEAMEERGYSKQEKLEFYSDFVGYKQANQVMKIDTTSVREYKDKIDQSLDINDKINIVLNTTQTHLQNIFQTGRNFLTKVGQPIMFALDQILKPINFVMGVLDKIPGLPMALGITAIFAALKGIATIFNKLAPMVLNVTSNFKGIREYLQDTNKEFDKMVQTLRHIGDKEFISKLIIDNEAQNVNLEDVRKVLEGRSFYNKLDAADKARYAQLFEFNMSAKDREVLKAFNVARLEGRTDDIQEFTSYSFDAIAAVNKGLFSLGKNLGITSDELGDINTSFDRTFFDIKMRPGIDNLSNVLSDNERGQLLDDGRIGLNVDAIKNAALLSGGSAYEYGMADALHEVVHNLLDHDTLDIAEDQKEAEAISLVYRIMDAMGVNYDKKWRKEQELAFNTSSISEKRAKEVDKLYNDFMNQNTGLQESFVSFYNANVERLGLDSKVPTKFAMFGGINSEEDYLKTAFKWDPASISQAGDGDLSSFLARARSLPELFVRMTSQMEMLTHMFMGEQDAEGNRRGKNIFGKIHSALGHLNAKLEKILEKLDNFVVSYEVVVTNDLKINEDDKALLENIKIDYDMSTVISNIREALSDFNLNITADSFIADLEDQLQKNPVAIDIQKLTNDVNEFLAETFTVDIDTDKITQAVTEGVEQNINITIDPKSLNEILTNEVLTNNIELNTANLDEIINKLVAGIRDVALKIEDTGFIQRVVNILSDKGIDFNIGGIEQQINGVGVILTQNQKTIESIFKKLEKGIDVNVVSSVCCNGSNFNPPQHRKEKREDDYDRPKLRREPQDWDILDDDWDALQEIQKRDRKRQKEIDDTVDYWNTLIKSPVWEDKEARKRSYQMYPGLSGYASVNKSVSSSSKKLKQSKKVEESKESPSNEIVLDFSPGLTSRKDKKVDKNGSNFKKVKNGINIPGLEEGKYFVFDVEATSTNPVSAIPFEVGGQLINKGKVIADYQTLVNHENLNIPKEVEKLTGVKTEDLKKGDDPKKVAEDLANLVEQGYTFVAHQAHFDVNVVKRFIKEHTGKDVTPNVVDTLTMAKAVIPKLRKGGGHSLNAIAERYNIENEEAHRALSDAQTTTKIIKELMKEDGEINDYINVIGYYGDSSPYNQIPGVAYRQQNANTKPKGAPKSKTKIREPIVSFNKEGMSEYNQRKQLGVEIYPGAKVSFDHDHIDSRQDKVGMDFSEVTNLSSNVFDTLKMMAEQGLDISSYIDYRLGKISEPIVDLSSLNVLGYARNDGNGYIDPFGALSNKELFFNLFEGLNTGSNMKFTSPEVFDYGTQKIYNQVEELLSEMPEYIRSGGAYATEIDLKTPMDGLNHELQKRIETLQSFLQTWGPLASNIENRKLAQKYTGVVGYKRLTMYDTKMGKGEQLSDFEQQDYDKLKSLNPDEVGEFRAFRELTKGKKLIYDLYNSRISDNGMKYVASKIYDVDYDLKNEDFVSEMEKAIQDDKDNNNYSSFNKALDYINEIYESSEYKFLQELTEELIEKGQYASESEVGNFISDTTKHIRGVDIGRGNSLFQIAAKIHDASQNGGSPGYTISKIIEKSKSDLSYVETSPTKRMRDRDKVLLDKYSGIITGDKTKMDYLPKELFETIDNPFDRVYALESTNGERNRFVTASSAPVGGQGIDNLKDLMIDSDKSFNSELIAKINAIQQTRYKMMMKTMANSYMDLLGVEPGSNLSISALNDMVKFIPDLYTTQLLSNRVTTKRFISDSKIPTDMNTLLNIVLGNLYNTEVSAKNYKSVPNLSKIRDEDISQFIGAQIGEGQLQDEGVYRQPNKISDVLNQDLRYYVNKTNSYSILRYMQELGNWTQNPLVPVEGSANVFERHYTHRPIASNKRDGVKVTTGDGETYVIEDTQDLYKEGSTELDESKIQARLQKSFDELSGGVDISDVERTEYYEANSEIPNAQPEIHTIPHDLSRTVSNEMMYAFTTLLKVAMELDSYAEDFLKFFHRKKQGIDLKTFNPEDIKNITGGPLLEYMNTIRYNQQSFSDVGNIKNKLEEMGSTNIEGDFQIFMDRLAKTMQSANILAKDKGIIGNRLTTKVKADSIEELKENFENMKEQGLTFGELMDVDDSGGKVTAHVWNLTKMFENLEEVNFLNIVHNLAIFTDSISTLNKAIDTEDIEKLKQDKEKYRMLQEAKSLNPNVGADWEEIMHGINYVEPETLDMMRTLYPDVNASIYDNSSRLSLYDRANMPLDYANREIDKNLTNTIENLFNPTIFKESLIKQISGLKQNSIDFDFLEALATINDDIYNYLLETLDSIVLTSTDVQDFKNNLTIEDVALLKDDDTKEMFQQLTEGNADQKGKSFIAKTLFQGAMSREILPELSDFSITDLLEGQDTSYINDYITKKIQRDKIDIGIWDSSTILDNLLSPDQSTGSNIVTALKGDIDYSFEQKRNKEEFIPTRKALGSVPLDNDEKDIGSSYLGKAQLFESSDQRMSGLSNFMNSNTIGYGNISLFKPDIVNTGDRDIDSLQRNISVLQEISNIQNLLSDMKLYGKQKYTGNFKKQIQQYLLSLSTMLTDDIPEELLSDQYKEVFALAKSMSNEAESQIEKKHITRESFLRDLSDDDFNKYLDNFISVGGTFSDNAEDINALAATPMDDVVNDAIDFNRRKGALSGRIGEHKQWEGYKRTMFNPIRKSKVRKEIQSSGKGLVDLSAKGKERAQAAHDKRTSKERSKFEKGFDEEFGYSDLGVQFFDRKTTPGTLRDARLRNKNEEKEAQIQENLKYQKNFASSLSTLKTLFPGIEVGSPTLKKKSKPRKKESIDTTRLKESVEKNKALKEEAKQKEQEEKTNMIQDTIQQMLERGKELHIPQAKAILPDNVSFKDAVSDSSSSVWKFLFGKGKDAQLDFRDYIEQERNKQIKGFEKDKVKANKFDFNTSSTISKYRKELLSSDVDLSGNSLFETLGNVTTKNKKGERVVQKGYTSYFDDVVKNALHEYHSLRVKTNRDEEQEGRYQELKDAFENKVNIKDIFLQTQKDKREKDFNEHIDTALKYIFLNLKVDKDGNISGTPYKAMKSNHNKMKNVIKQKQDLHSSNVNVNKDGLENTDPLDSYRDENPAYQHARSRIEAFQGKYSYIKDKVSTGMYDNSRNLVDSNKINASRVIFEDINTELDDTLHTLRSWSAALYDATEAIPGLSVAVLAFEQVVNGIAMVQKGTSFIENIVNMGKTADKNTPLGMMQATVGDLVGTAIGGFSEIIMPYIKPLMIAIAGITAGFLLIKGALDWSYQSHEKYVKSLEEEQKENRSKSRALQASVAQSRTAAEKNRNPIKQEQRDRRYELNKTQLDNANMTRASTAIDMTRAQNDTLWGDYGISAGLSKLSGNYESTAEQYEGTSMQTRKIKEATLANPFSTGAMMQSARYYDANQLAFGQMDEYKTELGGLYDEESRLIKRTGSVEEARDTPQFEEAINKFVEATGITRDHAEQYLDYMQTEHNVEQAQTAMKAEADKISSETEMKVQAIAFGGNPADVLGLNGIESQQNAMIKAQADMIQIELSGQLWWKAVWATITSPLKLITAPILIISDLLGAIFSFITGNWDNAAALGGKAVSRLNVGGEAAAYWSAWAQVDNTDFNAIGQSNVDETDRANYGNGPVGHENVGRNHGTNLINPPKQQKGGLLAGLFGGGKKGKGGSTFKDHKSVVRDNDRNNFFGGLFGQVLSVLGTISSTLIVIAASVVGISALKGILGRLGSGEGININLDSIKDLFSGLGEGKIGDLLGKVSSFKDLIPSFSGIKDSIKEKGIGNTIKDMFGNFDLDLIKAEADEYRGGSLDKNNTSLAARVYAKGQDIYDNSETLQGIHQAGKDLYNNNETVRNYVDYGKDKVNFVKGSFNNLAEYGTNVGSKWSNYLQDKSTSALKNMGYMPQYEDIDKFKESKETYLNDSDREYLIDKYNIDTEGMSAKPAKQSKAIREKLQEQGVWDEALDDLHQSNYTKTGVIGKQIHKYTDPWKDYAKQQISERYAPLRDNIKEKLNLGEGESIIETLKDPQKMEDMVKNKIGEKLSGYGENTVVGKYRDKVKHGKELLEDPEKLEEWGRDKYSKMKARGQAELEYYDGGELSYDQLSLPAKMMAFGRDKLGLEEGESFEDVMTNPERAIELGKKGYEAVKEKGFTNTASDLIGSAEEGTGILGEVKNTLGIDIDNDAKTLLGAEEGESVGDAAVRRGKDLLGNFVGEDFSVEDTLKDKFSSLFNKDTIGEAIEDIDIGDAKDSIITKGKEFLSGLFGQDSVDKISDFFGEDSPVTNIMSKISDFFKGEDKGIDPEAYKDVGPSIFNMGDMYKETSPGGVEDLTSILPIDEEENPITGARAVIDKIKSGSSIEDAISDVGSPDLSKTLKGISEKGSEGLTGARAVIDKIKSGSSIEEAVSSVGSPDLTQTMKNITGKGLDATTGARGVISKIKSGASIEEAVSTTKRSERTSEGSTQEEDSSNPIMDEVQDRLWDKGKQFFKDGKGKQLLGKGKEFLKGGKGKILNKFGNIGKNLGGKGNILGKAGNFAKNLGGKGDILGKAGNFAKNLGGKGNILGKAGNVVKGLGNLGRTAGSLGSTGGSTLSSIMGTLSGGAEGAAAAGGGTLSSIMGTLSGAGSSVAGAAGGTLSSIAGGLGSAAGAAGGTLSGIVGGLGSAAGAAGGTLAGALGGAGAAAGGIAASAGTALAGLAGGAGAAAGGLAASAGGALAGLAGGGGMLAAEGALAATGVGLPIAAALAAGTLLLPHLGDIAGAVGGFITDPIGSIGGVAQGAMNFIGDGLGAVGGVAKGAMDFIGGGLGAIGGAAGGLLGGLFGGNRDKNKMDKLGPMGALGMISPLGGLLGGLFGDNREENKMEGTMGGMNGGIMGALGMVSPLGGLLGGLFGDNREENKMNGLGIMGALGMASPLAGLFSGEEGNQQKMNPLAAIMPGLGLAGMAAGGIMGLLGGKKDKDEKNLAKAQLSVPGLLEKIFGKNKEANSKSSGTGDLVGKILKAILKDKDNKNVQPSGDGGGVNIVIHNININTDDDPEKIKTAFMQLMVELKDQVSPRIVSRTVGEKPAAAENTSANNQQQQNTQDAQNATNQLQNANSAAQQQQNNNK